MSWLALLRNPLAWCLLAIVSLLAALLSAGGQINDLRDDLVAMTAERDAAIDERKIAEHDRDGAQAQNTLYALAEQRRQREAEDFRVKQAEIQAEQRARIAALQADRDDIDRTLARFVAQFSAAPESCRVATAQMEVACAAFSDY